MSRKKGFSLVELLIVLAVMAALIATITPVALNAIKKSKATQVAQNLKTLASAIENAAYVNGVDENGIKKPDGTSPFSGTNDITLLARDINKNTYGVWYKHLGSGQYEVAVFTTENVDYTSVKSVLENATSGFTMTSPTKIGLDTYSEVTAAYTFTFTVY